jgi:hypothetical protein
MVSGGEKVAIYEWQTNRQFLFPVLCPSSVRIEANANDWAEDVLRRLSGRIRLFAFHLNLTQTASFPQDRPALCRALARSGVSVVNAEVTNISKAFIQATCRRLGLPTTEAVPEGDPAEMLIIKTNLNYGGMGDKVLDTADLRILGCSAAESTMDAKSYKILKRRDVTLKEWNDPTLFVERFIQNVNDRFCRAYCLNEYLVISEVVDPLPIKKMPLGIHRQNSFFRFHEEELEAIGTPSARATNLAYQMNKFVRFLRLDFAGLDVVVDDDGRNYIIDVNTTPSWRDSVAPDIVIFLRCGLEALINRGGAGSST